MFINAAKHILYKQNYDLDKFDVLRVYFADIETCHTM